MNELVSCSCRSVVVAVVGVVVVGRRRRRSPAGNASGAAQTTKRGSATASATASGAPIHSGQIIMIYEHLNNSIIASCMQRNANKLAGRRLARSRRRQRQQHLI